MKKTVSPPGQLADIATLIAMAENILDVLESAEPDEPRIWKRALIKRNKAGEKKTYYRWYCSWHNGKKTVRVYLGSCIKMSGVQAIEKAKKLRAEALPDAESGVRSNVIDGLTNPNVVKKDE
jgi:hypothetical protein